MDRQEEWGEELCHYLDDFLVFGKPGSEECARNLSALVK